MRGLIETARQRPERVLLCLVLAHLLLKLALFPRTMDAVLVGDERYYLDAGRTFSNTLRDLVAFRELDTSALVRDGVGNGWFMPGMGLVLTPLFLVVPDASQPVIHAYLGVVTSVAFLAVVQQTRRVLGDWYAAAILVFPGLVPIWLIFSYCAWGDLMAGIAILLFVLQLVTIGRGLREGRAPTLRQGALLGLVAITIVYLRSSALVVSAGLLVVLGIGVLFLLRGRARLQGMTSLALAGAVFVAILAPWSIAVSQAMNGPVLTTTSVPTVLGNTFGDGEKLCFGPCDPYSTIWFSPMRYGREVAEQAGIGEVQALTMMSEHARRDVTPSSYSRNVLENLGRYVGEPHYFSKFIKSPGIDYHDPMEWVWRIGTHLLWWPVLIMALAGFLSAYRRPFEDQMLSLITKLGIGALLLQPFVHISGPRYWTTAGPLFALSAALWLGRRRVRSDVETATSDETDGRLLSWLHRIQLLLVGGTVLVAVGVTALALA